MDAATLAAVDAARAEAEAGLLPYAALATASQLVDVMSQNALRADVVARVDGVDAKRCSGCGRQRAREDRNAPEGPTRTDHPSLIQGERLLVSHRARAACEAHTRAAAIGSRAPVAATGLMRDPHGRSSSGAGFRSLGNHFHK